MGDGSPSTGSTVDTVGIPKNSGTPRMDGFFSMENPFLIDDLGVPLFSETSIYDEIHKISSASFLRSFVGVVIGSRRGCLSSRIRRY